MTELNYRLSWFENNYITRTHPAVKNFLCLFKLN